jgi:hypothetical protein
VAPALFPILMQAMTEALEKEWRENKMEMPQHQHSEKCKAVDSSSDKLESKRKAAPAMLPPPH